MTADDDDDGSPDGIGTTAHHARIPAERTAENQPLNRQQPCDVRRGFFQENHSLAYSTCMPTCVVSSLCRIPPISISRDRSTQFSPDPLLSDGIMTLSGSLRLTKASVIPIAHYRIKLVLD